MRVGDREIRFKRTVLTHRCAICGRDTTDASCIHGSREALERLFDRLRLQPKDEQREVL